MKSDDALLMIYEAWRKYKDACASDLWDSEKPADWAWAEMEEMSTKSLLDSVLEKAFAAD